MDISRLAVTEGVPTDVPTNLNDEHSAQSEGFQEQLPLAGEKVGEPVVVLEPFTSGLLDLSRQQRNLLLLRPLFFLELNKQRIGSDTNGDQGLFDGIDTHYLALSVLDFMMEATTIQMGCLFEEALDHLKKVAHSMKPALSEKNATRVADVVLDALWNRGREFNSDYFDAPTRSTKFIRFRLIEGEPSGIEDRYHYRPTPEGYLVYLGMLDLSVEDSQELMAKMLDLLVQRGRFEAALEVAKRARKLSIEYRQLIRDRLSRAYRAPGSINWSREMSGKLNDARQHVQARQAEDQRMEESVRDNLVRAEDSKVRQDLHTLFKMVHSAGLLRSQLVSDITVAPEKFLDAQRAMFRARRPSGLPDLETRLLPQLLELPGELLTKEADTVISALYPPAWPKVYDLNTVFSLLLERRAEDSEPEADDGELEPFEPILDQFSRELITGVEEWLRQQFTLPQPYRVEELLALAQADGLDNAQRRCLVLILYRCFAQSETLYPQRRAGAEGRFEFDVAKGTNLVFYPLGEPCDDA